MSNFQCWYSRSFTFHGYIDVFIDSFAYLLIDLFILAALVLHRRAPVALKSQIKKQNVTFTSQRTAAKVVGICNHVRPSLSYEVKYSYFYSSTFPGHPPGYLKVVKLFSYFHGESEKSSFSGVINIPLRRFSLSIKSKVPETKIEQRRMNLSNTRSNSSSCFCVITISGNT